MEEIPEVSSGIRLLDVKVAIRGSGLEKLQQRRDVCLTERHLFEYLESVRAKI